ncbi:CRISPR-associated helicase Cas3' [Streptomyces paromomycinus]|uniref:CRISPR-associated helicase/endonuclease Cas3 n=1 Tax=Streptomyces paromomycinus TaxID=92743 RepID=A0A401VUW8_STREY|nr:CRISPR-associated helicase Cas3' [Streptomyces paromomycinus]GCD40872.1 CRISPR-associated helicase/endonuclease Cas3 [Streptomyces paromomycinus]
MGAEDVPNESLWGKSRGLDPQLPPYPLVRHLLDAAAMALHLWDEYLSANQRCSIAAGLGVGDDEAAARAAVGLCAGLHDVGKLSGFQFCSRHGRAHLDPVFRADAGTMTADRMGHDVAGLKAAEAALAALGFDTEDEYGAAARIAEIIGGHHGRFHRPDDTGGDDPFLGTGVWERQRVAHVRAVHCLLGAPAEPESFDAPAAVLVTGVVILADWLVSQADYLRRRQQSLEASLEAHFVRSCADAAGLLAEAGLTPVELSRRGFSEAYGIAGEPNPLQRSVMEELPGAVGGGGRGGILLVTAAPGDGKSEAALEAERVVSAAFGTRGLAFLLPTMATSDQMYGRVAGALRRQAGDGAGLTLVHSMAWLNDAYSDDDLAAGTPVVTCDGDERAVGRERAEADMRPRQWLRGAKRPLLAQFTVGTVDQALMAVLPVRHNALRLLALSNKTFIVDEAHAYDPYMQVLLARLLNWLGAYGVPVVLLSATLPASVSDRLIKEYLRGAGHRTDRLAQLSFPAPYPGWLYVDAAAAPGSKGPRATAISEEAKQAQAVERSMALRVQVEPVTHGPTQPAARRRLAVIERLLAPVVEGQGGVALVVCNTVADAQETYQALRARVDDRSHRDGGDVQLLHARFPGEVRERRTASVTGGLGRTGPRPVRRIVVATQVVEQSLDLDADLVISDLAPLALLLQRAGRCWRHENWWARRTRADGPSRPAWAGEPVLVVLDPLAGGGSVPRHWGEVYTEHLLAATSAAVAALDGRTVAVPGEVQALVESVHGAAAEPVDWEALDARGRTAWSAHRGKELAERGQAGLVAIPRAQQVGGLHALHSLPGEEDEWETATRLGAESARLLCVYLHPDGRTTLDLDGQEPLPAAGPGDAVTAAAVRAVMRRTVPVRGTWFSGEDRERLAPPAAWGQHPLLSEVLVLCQPVVAGVPQPVAVSGKRLHLDEDLGLVRQ